MSGRLFTDEQFWSRVIKTEDGCWFWNGTYGTGGYGHLSVRIPGAGGKVNPVTVQAHRMSWEIHTGSPVPDGLEIDHLCRNRCCVNPGHLEPVTHLENVQRATA